MVTNPGSQLVIKHVIIEDRYAVPDIKQFLAEERYQHESNQSQIAPLKENTHHRDVRRTNTFVPSNNIKIKILVRTTLAFLQYW